MDDITWSTLYERLISTSAIKACILIARTANRSASPMGNIGWRGPLGKNTAQSAKSDGSEPIRTSIGLSRCTAYTAATRPCVNASRAGEPIISKELTRFSLRSALDWINDPCLQRQRSFCPPGIRSACWWSHRREDQSCDNWPQFVSADRQ